MASSFWFGGGGGIATPGDDYNNNNFPQPGQQGRSSFWSDYSASKNDGSMIDTDNSSYQCPGWAEGCVACSSNADEKPLWWLLLRWLRMMLMRAVHSYHAKPIILVLIPLGFGLLVGYIVGHRHEHRPTTTDESADKKLQKSLPSRQRLSERLVHWSLSTLAGFYSYKNSYEQQPFDPTCEEKTIEQQEGELPRQSCECVPLHTSSRATTEADTDPPLPQREHLVRTDLKSDRGCTKESGVPKFQVPRHIAVIMDGNRRYGKMNYGNASRGHWDGSSKLVEFAKWCIAEEVSALTVYAFSTENWNRDPAEVASLMAIFAKYCDELRIEALKRNIKIMVLSTDYERIPSHVRDGMNRMVSETASCQGGLTLNICMSYGSRGEIVEASRTLAQKVAAGSLQPSAISEKLFDEQLLTSHCGEPDVLIRTSGEIRISNFLLWQLAYAEMFFLDKPWPAVEKDDLLDVIRAFAKGRQRRFGK